MSSIHVLTARYKGRALDLFYDDNKKHYYTNCGVYPESTHRYKNKDSTLRAMRILLSAGVGYPVDKEKQMNNAFIEELMRMNEDRKASKLGAFVEMQREVIRKWSDEEVASIYTRDKDKSMFKLCKMRSGAYSVLNRRTEEVVFSSSNVKEAKIEHIIMTSATDGGVGSSIFDKAGRYQMKQRIKQIGDVYYVQYRRWFIWRSYCKVTGSCRGSTVSEELMFGSLGDALKYAKANKEVLYGTVDG